MIKGDHLAAGGISAVFPACETGVSQDKWKAAFEDYDSAAFLAGVEAEKEAYQERKIQRQLDFEAELEARDHNRPVIETPEVSRDEQLEMRFGSRYSNSKTSGIPSPVSGEIIPGSGN
jgi:hypothetical protein